MKHKSHSYTRKMTVANFKLHVAYVACCRGMLCKHTNGERASLAL